MINGKIIKKALIGTLIFGVGFVSGIIAEKKKMNAEFEALQNEYHEKKKKERKEKEVKEAYEEVANEYTNPVDTPEEEKTESDNSEETSSDEDDEDDEDEPVYLTNLGSYVEDPDDFDDEETESDDETVYEEINGVMQISEEMFLENKWDYEVEDYHVWTNLRVTDHFNTLVWQDDLDDKFGEIIETFVGEHLYLVNHRLERVYDIKYETLDYQMNDEDDRDWK